MIERRRLVRPSAVIVLLVAALVGDRRPSSAQSVAGMDAATTNVMAAYLAHPQRHRRALLKLANGDLDAMPSPVLLALADARLRGGSFGPAAELCQRVLARDPQEPWTSWAAVGKAWADAGAGADQRAADQLVELANGGGQSALLASFLLGLLDGAHGNFERSLASFERVGSSASYDGLRMAGRLGAALARYWQGQYDAALVAFDEIPGEAPSGPLVDDARYGSARARLARGDRTGAVAALQDLAKLPRRGVRVRYTQALLNLDPKAFLRAAIARHRRAASGMPEVQVAAALDSDGGALARAALLTLAAPDDDTGAVAVPEPTPEGTERIAAAASAVASPTRGSAGARPPVFAFTVLAAILVLGLVALVRAVVRR